MSRLTPTLAVIATAGALVTGCSSGDWHSSPDKEHRPKATPGAAARWGYSGKKGPDNWDSINKEFATCKEGHAQSPINLGKAHHIDARKDVDIHYGKTTVELENDGHTVKGNVAGGNRISMAGTSYELEQFHFHLPSEHTIDHKGTAMEMHFVNKNAKGRVAVLSMLMDQKGANSPFGSLWKSLPKKHNTTAKVHGGIDLNSFVPKDRAEFQYAGSLTTPPCSESVNWVVFKKPLTVTAGQVDAYHDLYPKSNRPVQHLDGRTVDDTDK